MNDQIEQVLAVATLLMTVFLAVAHAFAAFARGRVAAAEKTADRGDDIVAAKLYAQAMTLQRWADRFADLVTLGLTYRQRMAALNPTPSLERVEAEDTDPATPRAKGRPQ